MAQVMKPIATTTAAVRPAVQSPLPIIGGVLAVCFACALVLVGGALLISLVGGYLVSFLPPVFDANKVTFWWSAINRH
jgi:hypothetical protein